MAAVDRGDEGEGAVAAAGPSHDIKRSIYRNAPYNRYDYRARSGHPGLKGQTDITAAAAAATENERYCRPGGDGMVWRQETMQPTSMRVDEYLSCVTHTMRSMEVKFKKVSNKLRRQPNSFFRLNNSLLSLTKSAWKC